MKKIIKYESGRSMVEMLGVLSIIGVLSIGGIAGYQMAMSSYRANETINDVMMWATTMRGIPFDAYARMLAVNGVGPHPNLSLLGSKTKTGYPISGDWEWEYDVMGEAIGDFKINVKNVPTAVCEKIITMRPDDSVGIWPNGEWSTKCDATDDKNDMYFVFDNFEYCQSICADFRSEWSKKCGSTWSWCDPKLGLICWSWTNGSKTTCFGSATAATEEGGYASWNSEHSQSLMKKEY